MLDRRRTMRETHEEIGKRKQNRIKRKFNCKVFLAIKISGDNPIK